MKKKIIAKYDYKNGDGFAVAIQNPPKECKQKADVICLMTAKGKKGMKQYYTPDEAMAVGMGLIQATDAILEDFYKNFRGDIYDDKKTTENTNNSLTLKNINKLI